MGEISLLWELQQLDRQEQTLATQLKNLPLQGEIQALEQKKGELGAVYERFQLEAKQSQEKAQETEQTIAQVTAKKDRLEQELYSGQHTSAKELEQMQHKLSQLVVQAKGLEDQLLQQLLAQEEQETQLAEIVPLLDEVTLQLATMRHEADQASQVIESQLAELPQQRQHLQAKTEEKLLQVYRQVAAAKGGHAVAAVQGDICLGCRLSLPTGLVGKLLTNQRLQLCPNCGRILYYQGVR